MKFARSTIAVLVLATIGIPGARAQAAQARAPATATTATPIRVPNVPFNLQVPAGNEAFLLGHGVGTQNYVCLPVGDAVKFVLFTPQATLFGDDDKQLTSHFFSPNPIEAGAIRVTWEHSRDSSTVWGKVEDGDSSTDAAFVAPDAIAWLKVTRKGAQNGPTGGDTLTKTTFIQRLNTAGGLAPKTGCSVASDLGHEAFVPYTADYFFYSDR